MSDNIMLKIGKYCKKFRIVELELTLRDVGGEENIKTLSSFEHGRSTNIKHLQKYIKACKNYEQRKKFIDGILNILEGENNDYR